MQQAKEEVPEKPVLDARDACDPQGWDSPVSEEQPQNTGFNKKEDLRDGGDIRLKRLGEVSLWGRENRKVRNCCSLCMVVSAAEEQTPDSWKEPWCLENTRTGQLHSLLSWTFPTELPFPTVASEPWGAWMHAAKRVTPLCIIPKSWGRMGSCLWNRCGPGCSVLGKVRA